MLLKGHMLLGKCPDHLKGLFQPTWFCEPVIVIHNSAIGFGAFST